MSNHTDVILETDESYHYGFGTASFFKK